MVEDKKMSERENIDSKFRFSALLSNYNHAVYLPEILQIILNQTRPFDEIIIIDDKSTDNSVEIIEEITRDFDNVKFIKLEKNIGVNKACELAVSEA